MLVLLRKFLDFFQCLGLLVLELGAFTLDLADGTGDRALVLLGLLLRVDLWLAGSHIDDTVCFCS